MTGNFWRSFFVAAMFAVHPLHVESVAWIAERKDVLCAFFWMLTIRTYIQYVNSRSSLSYLLFILCFIGGLLSKPMIVTLPFVLLLLDYWPLKRFHFQKSFKIIKTNDKVTPFNLIWEKTPAFLLVAISCVITFYAQKFGGAVASLNTLPISARISTACISYIKYIEKMVFPVNLSFFYPYATTMNWWEFATSVLFLLFISFMALKTARNHPYFIVGWLWYLGTLVPVIGIIQIGGQSLADRYTYIPLIGLFIISAWGIPELLKKFKYKKLIISISSASLILILLTLTWKQTTFWENSIILYEHALEVTSDNYLAHNNLGTELEKAGYLEEAIIHYNHAVRINPLSSEAHTNIGSALYIQGDTKNAIPHFISAINIKPNNGLLHYNIGLALEKEKQLDKAVEHFFMALKLNPEIENIHEVLGFALFELGQNTKAIHHYLKALNNNASTNLFKIYNNLGTALYKNGNINEAINHYLKALEIKPDLAETYNNLGVAFIRIGNLDKAISYFQKAIEVEPNYLNAKSNLKKLSKIRQVGKN